ncbi:hypothetical protein N7509_012480 [Penicillium cosmopolitanum]|uniref:Uncharacterized protein n=1 Tax=Penicillium cosmopolitanum TaxID=1131564 RepID=A0A9W9VH98_9EURO|nr:uncharacterized protein N7509_012480 [Penicillium cosmopolitanum]KAJ5379361.1 hypothetical protein N7509_012480 [Penicillium cosmopolitanum]
MSGLELVCPLIGELAVFDPVESGIVGLELGIPAAGPDGVDPLGISGWELVWPAGDEPGAFGPVNSVSEGVEPEDLTSEDPSVSEAPSVPVD